jgi:hypothetical protein
MSRVSAASKILRKTVLAAVDQLVIGIIDSGRDWRKDSIASINVGVNITTDYVLVRDLACEGNLLTMLGGKRSRFCHHTAMP